MTLLRAATADDVDAVADVWHRARRFYTREGWSDAGPFDYEAQGVGGSFPVPCHRYEKRLSR